MDFYAILDQVVGLLHQRQRVTYRALKVQFHLDDEALEALKDELLYAHPQVRDDAGRGLVWLGDTSTALPPMPAAPQSMEPHGTPTPRTDQTTSPVEPYTPEAGRRQLTVMFCDLVDSTRLSPNSIPKSIQKSSVPIRRSAPRSLPDLMGTLHSS
jgi:hypothetical protein